MPVARMGQYIGAKVTPSFFENPIDGTNDWVQGITYEELTVVTYDSKLYISKKPVRDITVEPTNTEYWLEYPSGGGGCDEIIPLTLQMFNNDTIIFQNCFLLVKENITFLVVKAIFTLAVATRQDYSVAYIEINEENIPNYALPPYQNQCIGNMTIHRTGSGEGFTNTFGLILINNISSQMNRLNFRSDSSASTEIPVNARIQLNGFTVLGGNNI